MDKKIRSFRKISEEDEKERILNNFYTKKIKNGRTSRADYLDRLFLSIIVFLIGFLLVYRVVNNFIISLIISGLASRFIIKYVKKYNERNREKKIEEIKEEYKIKLEEERIISEDENIEDYIIERYYEKKQELKSNMNFFKKENIFKLYLLFLMFFIASYFVSYPTYYRVVSVIIFVMATWIGSYHIVEYFEKKDEGDLLDRDIDV